MQRFQNKTIIRQSLLNFFPYLQFSICSLNHQGKLTDWDYQCPLVVFFKFSFHNMFTYRLMTQWQQTVPVIITHFWMDCSRVIFTVAKMRTFIASIRGRTHRQQYQHRQLHTTFTSYLRARYSSTLAVIWNKSNIL